MRGIRIRGPRLVFPVVVGVRGHRGDHGAGRGVARAAGRAAAPPAPLLAAPSVRTVLPIRVALLSASSAAPVRNRLAPSPAPQTQAGTGLPPSPLLRTAQRVPQEESGGVVLILVRFLCHKSRA